MDGRTVGPVRGPDFRSEILSGPIRGPEFDPGLYLVRSVVRILVQIFLGSVRGPEFGPKLRSDRIPDNVPGREKFGPTICTGPEFRYDPAVHDYESFSSKYSFEPYD